MIIFLLACPGVFALKPDSTHRERSHYSLAVGIGWSHYINSMVTVSTRDVQKDFIGTSLRFLWEPPHRLSLGLETGFYRQYRVHLKLSDEYTMDSRMYLVPLLLVVRMRIVDQFYLSVAPGLTLQYSTLSGVGDKESSTQLSLANFQVCASYFYPVSKLFLIGGEARLFYIGLTEDYMYSFHVVCAVKL
ncbi:MAG TPA: hypothetical protein VMC08_08830 [Bacteroidales bacterium]|nr:hypothetical protein [Bacteroidales bacterium]